MTTHFRVTDPGGEDYRVIDLITAEPLSQVTEANSTNGCYTIRNRNSPSGYTIRRIGHIEILNPVEYANYWALPKLMKKLVCHIKLSDRKCGGFVEFTEPRTVLGEDNVMRTRVEHNRRILSRNNMQGTTGY